MRPQTDNRNVPIAAPDPPDQEARAIAFLIAEVGRWPDRGWIDADTAGKIVREYSIRMAAQAGVAATSVHGQPNSPLVSGFDPSAAAASRPLQTVSLASVLEAHSVKLFALLAALFIFVGMRQILGWTAGRGLVADLIPLLPLALSVGLFYAGTHPGAAGSLGRYVYCTIAIGLAAITVYTAQTAWLGNALPRSVTLALASGAASGLAAWALRRTGDSAFLHPLLGAMALALLGGLQAAFPSRSWIPAQSWAYGLAYLGIASFLLRRAHVRSEPASSLILRVWGYFFVAAVCMGAAGLAMSGESLSHAGFLALAAGIVLCATAPWFGALPAVYIGAVMAASGSVILLASADLARWYGLGLAAVAACGLAIGLGRSTAMIESIAPGYRRIAWLFGGIAGTVLLVRFLASLHGVAPSLASSDWIAGVLLAAACSIIYVRTGRVLEVRWIVRLGIAAAVYALTVAANRILSPFGSPGGVTLARDLLTFIVLALLFGLSRRADWIMMDFVRASGAAAWLGLFFAFSQTLSPHHAPAAWIFLAVYAAVFAVAAVALRREPEGSVWAWGMVVASGAIVGLLAGTEDLVPVWTRPITAGLGLSLAAWAWFGASRLAQESAPIARRLRGGAALLALVGAALATISAQTSPGVMVAVYASALALMVTMGAVGGGRTPILASFLLVLLCPIRFTPEALQGGGGAGSAILSAILFAELAAAIYALAAWKMKEPQFAWLTTAAVAIAGTGGYLFGEGERLISLTAVGGLAAGAIVVGIATVSGSSRLQAYIAPTFLIAANLLLSARMGVSRHWIALSLLPLLAAMLVFAAADVKGAARAVRRPLRLVVSLTAGLALSQVAVLAFAKGGSSHFPAATTLLVYALVFGLFADPGDELDHGAGVVSTASLIGGWFFGFQVSAMPASIALCVSSAGCAVQYARIAWRHANPAPGYGSGIALTCAWMGLIGSLIGRPAVEWGAFALVPVIVLFVVGQRLGGSGHDSLAGPLRDVSIFTAGAAVAWTIGANLVSGKVAHALLVSGTVTAYGLTFLAAYAVTPSFRLLAAACLSFEISVAYSLASLTATVSEWAAGLAVTGIVWVALVRGLPRQTPDSQAGVFSFVATTSLVAAAAGALFSLAAANAAREAVTALVVVASCSAALYRIRRNPWHAHGAYLTGLMAYTALVARVVQPDGFSADIFAAPWGAYVVSLGYLWTRRAGFSLGSVLQGVALAAALSITFAGFLANNTPGGTPLHAVLLLTECILAIGWGLATRSRIFVYQGVGFAFAFVAVGCFAAAAVWTGIFAVITGVLLLATVFYASSHQDSISRWTSRLQH